MKLVLAINYETVKELEQKLEQYVVSDRGAWIIDGAENVSAGLIWDDDGVEMAAIPDNAKVTVYGNKYPQSSGNEFNQAPTHLILSSNQLAALRNVLYDCRDVLELDQIWQMIGDDDAVDSEDEAA